MSKAKTIVQEWDALPLLVHPDHPKLYQKQFVLPREADAMHVALHAVLFERLGQEGAVLPHDHDCCEIICITKGAVEAYYQGGWHPHKAGDTLLIPAGEIHSVYNPWQEESEQVSIFLPADAPAGNRMFGTRILSGIPLPQPKEERTA
ncbi:MAG TPA: AraC family ligand binding domain-containing protein [Firmicutes bacterium]|nr:AraC family ligand binding domain-containing protein [Bacillota bacterium]